MLHMSYEIYSVFPTCVPLLSPFFVRKSHAFELSVDSGMAHFYAPVLQHLLQNMDVYKFPPLIESSYAVP